jgi:hypothetical protein
MVRQIRLQSTWARAVVPVAAGIGFFALLGLFLWGLAGILSGNETGLLRERSFEPGPARVWASSIDRDGPILFADLTGTDGAESVVLNHVGDDPERGFELYLPYPADRTPACAVVQDRGTRMFVDCEGRTIDVTDLATPAPGIAPVVSADGVLSLDLVPVTAESTAPGTTG